jgi:hypothetical protein
MNEHKYFYSKLLNKDEFKKEREIFVGRDDVVFSGLNGIV